MPHPQSRRAKEAKRKRAVERGRRTAGEHHERAERHTSTEERRLLTKSLRRKRDRAWNVAVVALGVLVVSALGFVVWNEVRPDPELAGVERPADNGRGHRSGMTYASLTPTSGAHDSRSPLCGVYPTPLDPTLAVHALEHGVVVLWFDAARSDLLEGLTEVADGWDSHVIVSPNVGLGEPIIATAWNRLKAYPGMVPEVEEFVDTYRLRGPETVDCDMG